MKIALAQMKVIPGMPERNIRRMLEMIENAKKQKVDLIAFPEMCVGGYLVGDKWTNDEFCKNLMLKNKRILDASDGIAIAYGNIYLDQNNDIEKRIGKKGWFPNKDGRIRRYNSIYVIQNGKPVEKLNESHFVPKGIQPKNLLPTYRIFDDQRYFFSLEDIAKDFSKDLEELVQPFMIEVDGKKVPIGFEVCEDLWCEDYRKDGNAINITKILLEKGAKKIINLSASPWTYGKNNARDRRVLFLKQESNNKFVEYYYVNCTGAQNNGKNIVTFDGGSTVYNKDGFPIVFSKKAYLEELLVIDDKVLDKRPKIRKEAPKVAQKLEALIWGMRAVKEMKNFPDYPNVVIGLSGGLDSSIVAAISVLAYGKNKVYGVNMPTVYNSEKTKSAAAHVANALGIKYITIPIQELFEINSRIIREASFDGKKQELSSLEQENIQAKIRSIPILSNLSAKVKGIYTSNANKDEVILGYGTLDGDLRGSILPIGDMTKTELVTLARYLNKEVFSQEVIPEVLLPDELWNFSKDQVQPSAELKDNQVDPIKFGYHCALLEAFMDYKKFSSADFMQLYFDGKLDSHLDKYFDGLVENPKGHTLKLMKRWGVDDPETFLDDLIWFERLYQSSDFKRIQAAPIIITSKSAFGFDFRESILPYEPTERQLELQEKILKMKRYEPRN